MRVDDELHRQACDLADLGKNLLRRLQAERTGRIDGDEAIELQNNGDLESLQFD